MTPGYRSNLYILAFDHRRSFERFRGIQGRAPSPAESDRISAGKRLIFDAFLLARENADDSSGLAILTDEQYGGPLLLEARQQGLPSALATEKSGQDELAFEYGPDFGAHIEHFHPDFAKVLVRFNVEGDTDVNRRQAARLRELSEWLRDRPTRLLLELLVPPTDAQLASVDGRPERYDTELRPQLMQAAIRQLQEEGIEPDLWKIEGLDSRDDCRAIVAAAQADGRTEAGCLVLGRGEGDDAVTRWLDAAAPVEGYRGFAIGRTIWSPPLARHFNGGSRDTAEEEIAEAFLRFVYLYRQRVTQDAETATPG